MISAQERHGPDGVTLRSMGRICFAHHLLKITREDDTEAQPIFSPADPAFPGVAPVLLVVDARIYNREQLAAELDIAVGEIASLSDSAFVLLAWRQWGPDCVHRLLGAFAFAIWDDVVQQLFLACDHAGERSLYYVRTEGFFAFATSARAILTCPSVSAEMDETTLARDLTGIPPEPSRTRFRDVRSIAPGHSLLVSARNTQASPRRYWSFYRLPPTRFVRDEEYVEAFLEIFDEAVRCRLRTTGGVASHLSSGLDSGAVTATAAGLLGDTNRKLTAFTSVPCAGFSGDVPRDCIGDEGPFAAEVAALYPNIDHRLIDSSGSDMMRETARTFPWLDRPLGAPLNQIWLNLIFDQAAALGIKVLLTGYLGNATISYSGSDIIQRSFRRGRWIKAFREAVRLRRSGVSSGRDAISMTFFAALPWSLRSRLDPTIRSLSLDDTAILPERGRALQLIDQVRRYVFLSRTDLPPLMESFFHANGLGEHGAMANVGWGIETRDATADKRVFEFCASIPIEQYLVDKPGRSLIRRAMRGRLPNSTLDRSQRGLQSADWYESLTRIRAEVALELILLERSPGARRLLDLDRLRHAVDHWPASAREAAEQGELYPMILPDGVAVGSFIRRSEEFARR